jgi:hypothetical protein
VVVVLVVVVAAISKGIGLQAVEVLAVATAVSKRMGLVPMHSARMGVMAVATEAVVALTDFGVVTSNRTGLMTVVAVAAVAAMGVMAVEAFAFANRMGLVPTLSLLVTIVGIAKGIVAGART